VNKLNNVNVIHSIHFHARFSSREGRWISSPRRTGHTSRSTAIQIVLLAPYQDETKKGRRCTVFTTPRPWVTSEPLFRWFNQLDLTRQSFVREFWTHGRNRYIDICALSIPRRCDSTFRALRISQLRTLSRSFTPRTHRKNPLLLLALEIGYYFGHYPRFKIIGEDRNKGRFKN